MKFEDSILFAGFNHLINIWNNSGIYYKILQAPFMFIAMIIFLIIGIVCDIFVGIYLMK